MKKFKKLEIVKKSLVELRNKQTKELLGGYGAAAGRSGCSPYGTQVNTCFTDSCCK